MKNKIKPALTPKEWQAVDVTDVRGWDDGSIYVGRSNDGDWNVSKKPHALIAILNAALLDSDPRKFTREWVNELREGTNAVGVNTALLHHIADALESYLPPDSG